MKEQLLSDNLNYWSGRASGYSDVNKAELKGCQHENWKRFITSKISKQFPGKPRSEIRVLDIGAGPGFLSIVLTEAGYTVTAADYTQAMLDQARENAGPLAPRIHFVRENAMDLSFPNAGFDVVLSRNLTWNLPDPEQAYREWLRVLKPDGLMMVFDANWYAYLFNDDLRDAYNCDRDAVANSGIEDYNIGENFDVMETIAKKMPLSPIQRPKWDIDTLRGLGAAAVTAEENVGEILYSEEEKLNYRSTPMFCVSAVKEM